MDTKQVNARFEADRQAQAMMDHPTIARAFDAGAPIASALGKSDNVRWTWLARISHSVDYFRRRPAWGGG
jgi:hypothetical protein